MYFYYTAIIVYKTVNVEKMVIDAEVIKQDQ